MNLACRGLGAGLLAVVGLTLAADSAGAQGIEDNPRCAQMVNVAACNCALQNGGIIRPDGRGFSDGRSPADRAGYAECMKKRGK